MAMNAKTDAGELMNELNTTPLIDVMLVLLTLLLITLPIQTHAVKLGLPANAAVTTPPPVVDLQVDFDGTVSWNGVQVDRGTLDAYLRHAAHKTPQPEIHVTANRLVHYDRVAKILADAQRFGVTHIGIIGTVRFVQ